MKSEIEGKKYWIALNMTPRLTPNRFHLLLENFQDPKKVWAASENELQRIPGFKKFAKSFCQNRAKVNLDKELEEIEANNLRIVTLEDEHYPSTLKNLSTPPPVLYLKGEYTKQDELALAIVGTRRCTPYGKLAAEKIAKELTKAGFTIVSGMAVGIDSAAHKGALAGHGRTIAVLGSGFSHIYPRENLDLMKRIVDCGCVISEFYTDFWPTKWSFPQRNRVISGLARGTLVAEAPQKSGALITAKLALEQGKEVFAIPGSINNENSRGTHKLIKEGAKLVENIRDIIEEFPYLKTILEDRSPESKEKPPLSNQEEEVLEALSYQPVHIDEVIESTGLTVTQISSVLLSLQMKDLIREVQGKRYVKL